MEENNGNGINEKAIAEHFKKILTEGLGVDINDPNYLETPERVARSYKEIFSGMGHTKEEVEKIFSKCFPTDYRGIVLEKNLVVFSMCPHHFLPVKYDVAVAYIPSDCGIGLSKLARIVELLAKKPALQESFTKEIVDMIEKYMHTTGVICMVKGEHYCMQMRGVKQKNSVTTTTAARGVFLDKPEMELKFYELVRNS